MSEQTNNTSPAYLSPNEAAKRLKVSPVTIRHWALDGKLAFITTPGGHRRFAVEEIERFAAENEKESPRLDSSLRVLVVDDSVDFAKLVSQMISWRSDTTSIQTANDGFEAGRQVIEFHPHVVILDLMMPGLDGFSVCRNIKQNPRTKDIRVIAMTGFLTTDNEQKILQAGAETCLAKPIDKDRLYHLLGLEKN